MADPVAPAPSVDPAAPAPAPVTPAPGSSPSKDEVPKTWEEIFQHQRFKDLNKKATDAETALAEKLKAEQAAEEARRIKNGEHETVINELKPQAERAKALEAAFKTLVDAEIATIPKERQSLVPPLPPEQQMAWIQANRAILMGEPKKTTVNHPTNPASGSPAGDDNQTFTTAQVKDPAFYEKNRDAIIKATREGRIVD